MPTRSSLIEQCLIPAPVVNLFVAGAAFLLDIRRQSPDPPGVLA